MCMSSLCIKGLREQTGVGMRRIVAVTMILLGGGIAAPLAAQSGQVGGVVVGEGGRPLAAASVVVQGTSREMLTNDQGRFLITGLPDAAGAEVTLRVMAVGARSTERTVRVGDTNVRIEMESLAMQLEAIVVTGTAAGSQARSLGTARGEVRVAEVLTKTPPPSMQSLVAGNVAGVNLSTPPGNVGTGAAIRIRGTGSLSLGNTPIVFVDGVRIDTDQNAALRGMRGGNVSRLNDLNPNDIESIEVIKGPAAATLFGTEASAGVIQITTKSGQAGPPVWDVAIRQGQTYLSNPVERWPEVYDRSTQPCPQCRLLPNGLREYNVLQAQIDEGRGLPFVRGHNQAYYAGVRGGTGLVTYYASGEWDREEGYVPWNWKTKASGRLNLSLVPNSTINISTSLGFLRSNTRFDASGPFPAEIVSSIYWGTPAAANTRSNGWNWTPPEAMATVEALEVYDRTTASATVMHTPLPWLTQRVTAGVDIGNSIPSRLFPRSPLGASDYFGALSLGRMEVTTRAVTNVSLDYGVAATYEPTADVSLETAVGGQYYSRQMREHGAQGDRFPAPGPGTVSSAAVRVGYEDFVENKSVGLYVQEAISWKNRRFLTLALRGDANSAFGDNFAQVFFPKVSASWVVHEESFFRNVDFVSALRLRAAWGQAGRQPDVFAARQLYAPITAAGNNPGLTADAIGNPDLQPEIGEELEMGFDASVLNDRVSLRYTYYTKDTKDPILRRLVAPSSGFAGFQFINAGQINNRGHELEVDTRLLTSENLAWDLGFNYSANKSEVVDLGGLPTIVLFSQQHKEGYPVGAIFEHNVLSADLVSPGVVTNCLAEATPEQGGGTVPCNQAQKVYRGSPIPTWEGAVTSTLTLFGDLSLFTRVDFQGGYTKVSGDLGASHLLFLNSREALEATDPVLVGMQTQVVGGNFTQAGVIKGGFAKFREASLTYALPNNLSQRVGASAGSMTLSAYNIGNLWVAQATKFGRKDFDPELTGQRTSENDFGAYYQTMMPAQSRIGFSLRLTY